MMTFYFMTLLLSCCVSSCKPRERTIYAYVGSCLGRLGGYMSAGVSVCYLEAILSNPFLLLYFGVAAPVSIGTSKSFNNGSIFQADVMVGPEGLKDF